MPYDPGYLRWRGHDFKRLTRTKDGTGHWKCRNCGVRAKVARVLGCPDYPPTPFSLDRELRASYCGDLVARQVMEA
jgi:hypothetical protein